MGTPVSVTPMRVTARWKRSSRTGVIGDGTDRDSLDHRVDQSVREPVKLDSQGPSPGVEAVSMSVSMTG